MSRCRVTGKRRYPSREVAIDHAVSLMARLRDAGHRPLNVYVCPDCDGWHVGHRPRVLPASPRRQEAPAVSEPVTRRCDCHCRKPATDVVVTRGVERHVCEKHARMLRAVFEVTA